MKAFKALVFVLVIAAAGFVVVRWILFPELIGPKRSELHNGRVVVHYWEKWTGFEGDAIDAVISDFNASQNRIWVERLTVSEPERKLMLATAGGDPPDVGGLYSWIVNVYAEKNALTPLDKYAKKYGITRDQYIPVFWDIGMHRGFLWALPSTPGTIGLHWNKKLFRQAGLDPERPPTSIAQLDSMAEVLTIVTVVRGDSERTVRFTDLTPDERAKKDFTIVQFGFSPSEPGWWSALWSYWFGGGPTLNDTIITANSKENIAAMTWIQSIPKKYGVRNMSVFGASFGNFSSPQNAFLSGKVAMELQGVWMYNFIEKYSPQLEWGAAPFPSVDPAKYPGVTVAMDDLLVIPRGARHPDEAFEFIRYVNQQGPMEKLCLGQRKFSPLAVCSDSFMARHPNPYIKLFSDLARGPGARMEPRPLVWNECIDEFNVAFDKMVNVLGTPEAALNEVQVRMEKSERRALDRWNLVKADRVKEWSK